MVIQAPKVVHDARTPIAFLDPLADFYERLLPLETVEAIYAAWRPDGLDVWLVINQASEANREKIYEQELAVMQAFPGMGLDTHLIDRAEIDPNEAIDLMMVDAFLRFPRLPHA